MDGDGSEDTIEYDLEKRSLGNTIVLTINGKDFETAIDNYYPECDYVFYSGDIDVNDNFVELFMATYTPRESWMYLYRYNNENLELATTTYTVPASVSDTGTAEIKTDAPYIIYSGLEPIALIGDGSFGLLDYDDQFMMFDLSDSFQFIEAETQPMSILQQSLSTQETTKIDGTWKAVRTTEYDLDSSEYWYLVIEGNQAFNYPNVEDYKNGDASIVYPLERQSDGTAHLMMGQASTSGNIPKDYYSVVQLLDDNTLQVEAYRDTYILVRE